MKRPHFKNLRSMKYRMWLYFALFAALTLTLVWLLQVVFLGNYYEPMKLNEITNIGRQLEQAAHREGIFSFGTYSYPSETLREMMQEQSYKNGVTVMIIKIDLLSGKGMAVYSPQLENDTQSTPASIITNEDYTRYVDKLNAADGTSVSYINKNTKFNSKTAVFGTVLANSGIYRYTLYVGAPLAPMQTAVDIIQGQLYYVIIAVLVLSFLLSYFLSKKITRPLTEISHTASQLAKGDYNVSFSGSGYKEIDELADTLNYATGQLQKSDELKRDIIANVSHDLKTPLTMIRAYAEMIHDLSGENPQKRAAHTEIIMEESDRLTRLVNDILDLSKLQAGSAQLSLSRVDLGELAASILTRFQFLKEKEGYTITESLQENVCVRADVAKLEQVIYNLVGNAANYTGDDRTIAVRVWKEPGKGCFSVTDTGKGIPEEEKEAIWDRYYKSSKTHKRGVVGTGLGLSIVKNILVLHGAEFGVDSTEGQGSTFWFKLPEEQKKEED